MTKLLSAFLLCFLSFTTVYAEDLTDIPNEMYVSEHWISYTTSFDVETKTKKLGTVYRRILSFLLTYDFYDNDGQLLTSASARFFSIGAHFDVYDKSKQLLGMVEEKIFTFFPSFEILAPDYSKLARASMNFWGSQFTIYDSATDKVMAVMSRPFFRFKNNWTISVKDKALFQSKHIDPKLFITVLAFQSDSEYWQQQRNNDNNYRTVRTHAAINTANTEPTTAQTKTIQDELIQLSQDLHLHDIALPDSKALEALANQLLADYQATRGPVPEDTDFDNQVDDFVDYCIALVKSENTPDSMKKAILYLLQQRMMSAE